MNDPEEYEPQEHDELALKVLELVKEEVKAKMTETVDTLECFRKTNESLGASLRKEREEHRYLKSNYEKELNKAVREKEIEVRRELFGGFNRGDTIFHADYKWESKKCVQCSGEKKVVAVIESKEIKVSCPHCEGRGSIDSSYYLPKEDKIRTITLEIGERNKFIYFYLNRSDNKISVEKAFMTIDECQVYCDEKNKPKEE